MSGNQIKSTDELLIELIRVQSDSGTRLECDMAAKLLAIIAENPYFQTHPDLFGAHDGGDPLQRPVVWALKPGRSGRTVILNGHYDVVEIDSFGVLKPYALEPETLRQKMLETGLVPESVKPLLRDPDWLFGRGAADMKCGIAINLQMLFAAEDLDVSILFTAVSDEENLSAGARQAIGLYRLLQERFALDYQLAIVTEPDPFKGAGDPFNVMGGAAGKLLPVVVAKGRISHGALMLGGLNPSLIVAEVIRQVELSEDFQSRSCGCAMHPPTTLFMKDLKETYDVSMPEYCAAGFNLLFLHPANPLGHLEQLRRICEEAAACAVQKYSRTFDALADTGIMHGQKAEFQPEVLLVGELRERLARTCPGFETRLAAIEDQTMARVREGRTTIQDAGIFYIRSLVDLAQTSQPMVVVGLVPPFYPSVSNASFSTRIPALLDVLAQRLEAEGQVRIVNGAFVPGPTDLSYFACPDLASSQRVMDSMSLPTAAYAIDFETLATLGIPAVQVGPASAAVHEIGERVYLPDVRTHVPHIIRTLIGML